MQNSWQLTVGTVQKSRAAMAALSAQSADTDPCEIGNHTTTKRSRTVRRSGLMVTLVTACLLVITGFTAWAQDEEESPCAAACREAKEECVTSCGVHGNPIECEARCQDEAEDCLLQCD